METKMICLTTIILIGLSPALGQDIYDESGEIQSDPALEEIFRLKIRTDDLEDSSQLKTIRNGEEYDVGKIFSHLQITQRPRPVINLRPNGGHLVIHKNNNDKDHKPHHLSHNDEYIPIKIPSDTEYVIKPLHDSHHNHGGYYITKPEVQDHHNHHGEYNHEYNIHENGHNNHEYNNHEHFNGYNDHKYPHDYYPNYYQSRPYNHGNKPSTHGSYGHSPRPSIDSYYYNGHHSSKPHENYHGDYKPPHSHVPHGESSFHHDHKPYYHGNHDNYAHLNHKYHEKPNIGYDFHHDNHRPYHNGYESHSNSHSSHDKPLHSYYNYYDIHKHGDNSHFHGPSNENHEPYHHYDQFNHHDDKNDYHSSSHKPTHNIYKPSEPAHKPHKNYHHKPSKPSHPHGSNGDSHNHHGLSHHEGNLWKPYVSGVNNHKTVKHKDKPKRYQLQEQNEQIKSNSESSISEASFHTERLESTVRLQKDKTVNHTEKNLHSTAKPMHGSVENTTNSAMNVHVDKISESTSPNQTGGHVMHIIVNKNKNTHGPLSSHIQHTSKPNTYKNKTSPLITETNTEYGNNSKPHSTTSYEKPKPILVTASNRPNTSHNHASETHSNLDRPEQKPDNFTPEHEPNNNNHFPNEHHGNHYGVIEPVFETQFPSSGAVSGIEENSDLHQQLIFMPNNGESSDEFVENSYELISSHEGNHHEPHSSLELGGATGDYQINNPHHHNNGPYFHENYNLDLQSGEESSDKSGEDNYGSYHQSNNHQCHTPGNHDYHHHSKPNSQQSHSQKPSYNSYPHQTHYHGHHNNERPNRFSSSHKLELNDYHKELYRPYQDEQNSHSNHHNYYEKPVSNYHTHQVSKPFSIDHGSPYGVSGIFINNFKKRPNFWYNHRSSEYENGIETFRDDDYRERRRNSGGDSSLRKSVDIKDEEDYRSRSHTSKNSGYESVYKKSSKYDVGNPHSSSRRYQYSDIDSSDEEYSYSIPETFLGNFRDGRPPTIEYDLKEGYNNHLIQEAEKALAYVMNPYAYRPNIVQHNGLQHTSHQGLLIDPNHHQQHNIYNYIQPHHGHHSNRHEYATSTPKYHHSVGLETTHTPGHNPSIHSAGHHNTLAHEHPEALHSHQSNNIPVKYVYIPVLNNFQPYMQEYATKMAIPSSLSSNTLSSNLKLNRSNADYSKRLASSQSSSAVNSQEQVVKPSMKIFEAPIRISSSLPVETPQVVHESSPLLLHLLNSPKLTYLEAFPGNVDLNARDSKEHLRRVELLEEEEEVKVEAEDDDKPITSNWHQTQELHEKYSSKCKDVWDSILFAQKYGIEKQGRPFSRSKDEVSTAVQELEKKVESLISRRKRSNTLEPESGQDSHESNCIEVLKNALLSQLEILDIKRREEKDKDNKDGTQTMDKLEGDDLRLAESITVPESVPVNELKKDDLPITFESEQQVEMNDKVEAEQQESLDSSQDYHW